MAYLNWMRACWQCEGCGKDFVVEIDPGHPIAKGWGLPEVALDAVRGGEVVVTKGHTTTKSGLTGSSSVQHEMVLCGDCTRIADSIGPEEYQPSREEILRELGAHMEH